MVSARNAPLNFEHCLTGSPGNRREKPLVSGRHPPVSPPGVRRSRVSDLNKQINQVTSDLGQMKANLNALNGAIQQVNRLLELCQPKNPKAKEEALKEVLS